MRSITSGEGLWPLDQVTVPNPVKRAARGVVRVGSNVRFKVELHESADAAAKARAKSGAREKRFLPAGGVEWPVITDPGTLAVICSNEVSAAQPGFREICGAYESRGSDGAELLSEPLRDGATGFTLTGSGNELRIVTNYHVAREDIERAGRTRGEYGSRPQECLDTWVATAAGNRAQSVSLEANASEADWQAGRDWAVLRADLSVEPLELRSRPPRVDERIWVLGFPARTRRRPTDYPDADGSLRLASGVIVHVEDGLLVSDVDGVAGNSGSPVLDKQGRVIGIFRDHDLRDGEFDLRIGAYGGRALITPVTYLPTWLTGPKLRSVHR